MAASPPLGTLFLGAGFSVHDYVPEPLIVSKVPWWLLDSDQKSCYGTTMNQPTHHTSTHPDLIDLPAVWIIEEDGTHTPGKLIRSGSVWPGCCTVISETDYAMSAGVNPNARLWSRRNVLDSEGNRLG